MTLCVFPPGTKAALSQGRSQLCRWGGRGWLFLSWKWGWDHSSCCAARGPWENNGCKNSQIPIQLFLGAFLCSKLKLRCNGFGFGFGFGRSQVRCWSCPGTKQPCWTPGVSHQSISLNPRSGHSPSHGESNEIAFKKYLVAVNECHNIFGYFNQIFGSKRRMNSLLPFMDLVL